MSPSWRCCSSFIAPLWPRCSVSARQRMEVRGLRRSCTTSTNRSSALAPVAPALGDWLRCRSNASRTCSRAVRASRRTDGAVADARSAHPLSSSARSISTSRSPSSGDGRGSSIDTYSECRRSIASAIAASSAGTTSPLVWAADSSCNRRATRRVAPVTNDERTPASGSVAPPEIRSAGDNRSGAGSSAPRERVTRGGSVRASHAAARNAP